MSELDGFGLGQDRRTRPTLSRQMDHKWAGDAHHRKIRTMARLGLLPIWIDRIWKGGGDGGAG